MRSPPCRQGYYSRGKVGHYLTHFGKLLYVVRFGRTSTAQDLINAHSRSEGTPFEGSRATFASIVNTGLAPDVVAAAAYSTAVNFDGVSAKTINDSHVLLAQSIRDNPRIIDFEMRSPGQEPVEGYIEGSDVMLYVRRKFQRANGWEFELARQPLQVLRMRFFIRKRTTGSPLPMDWTLTGKSNSADFLGLGVQTCAYRGIGGRHNFSNGGPAELLYQVEYLSIGVNGVAKTGHFNLNKASMGWHFTTHDLSAVVPGTFVKATSLYDLTTAFDSAPLPTADFAILTT
jgi:hypothetical protein